jgi:predicted Fe-S protein YdhL (DUF1289 family)
MRPIDAALPDDDARQALVVRARRVLAAGGPAPSPCVSICQMDPASGLCAGCLRSLQEIGAWSSMEDADRRACWSRIADRALA